MTKRREGRARTAKRGEVRKKKQRPVRGDVYGRRGYARLVFARHMVERGCVCTCPELGASTRGS
jgi:hypothetical protein